MNYKKFNKILLLSLIIPLFIMAVVNYFIDPFYVFKSPLITNFNKLKPDLKRQERVTKILEYKLDQNSCDTIFVGSSRVDYSFDPEYYNKISGKKAKNMAIIGPDLAEIIEYTRTLIKIKPEVKTIIMGLDFFGFKDYARDKFEINKNPKVTIMELGSVLFSLDALNSSIETIKVNNNGEISTIYDCKTGTKIKNNIKDVKNLFLRHLNDYINGDGYYSNYKLSNKKIRLLKIFVEECKQKNINLILYTNPLHVAQIQAIKTAGSLESFVSWKHELSKITDYYDFFYINSVSTEPISDDMKNYFEASHYTIKVGNKILDRIIKGQEGYGFYITGENIANVIEKQNLEKSLKSWQTSNIQLVNSIEKLRK